jgi:hypothetical protein
MRGAKHFNTTEIVWSKFESVSSFLNKLFALFGWLYQIEKKKTKEIFHLF